MLQSNQPARSCSHPAGANVCRFMRSPTRPRPLGSDGRMTSSSSIASSEPTTAPAARELLANQVSPDSFPSESPSGESKQRHTSGSSDTTSSGIVHIMGMHLSALPQEENWGQFPQKDLMMEIDHELALQIKGGFYDEAESNEDEIISLPDAAATAEAALEPSTLLTNPSSSSHNPKHGDNKIVIVTSELERISSGDITCYGDHATKRLTKMKLGRIFSGDSAVDWGVNQFQGELIPVHPSMFKDGKNDAEFAAQLPHLPPSSSTSEQKKKRKRKPRVLNSQVVEPTDSDVQYGKGGGTNQNPGNVSYREKAWELWPRFREASKIKNVKDSKQAKYEIAEELKEFVLQHGRFLEMDKNDGTWHEVIGSDSHRKASQRLRDTTSDLEKKRKKLIKKHGIHFGTLEEVHAYCSLATR